MSLAAYARETNNCLLFIPNNPQFEYKLKHAPSMLIACMAGAWKKWVEERMREKKCKDRGSAFPRGP